MCCFRCHGLAHWAQSSRVFCSSCRLCLHFECLYFLKSNASMPLPATAALHYAVMLAGEFLLAVFTQERTWKTDLCRCFLSLIASVTGGGGAWWWKDVQTSLNYLHFFVSVKANRVQVAVDVPAGWKMRLMLVYLVGSLLEILHRNSQNLKKKQDWQN